MNCKNIKRKLNGKCVCKLCNKEILPQLCGNCKDRETKTIVEGIYTLKNKKCLKSSKNRLKQYSKKRSELEKSRYSVFTTNLNDCYFCSNKTPKDDLHELLQGRNRYNSIKYGFVLPLCRYHHNLMHEDTELKEEWKERCEDYFIKNIGTKEEFINTFKKNYL